jgi:hypothetical protein
VPTKWTAPRTPSCSACASNAAAEPLQNTNASGVPMPWGIAMLESEGIVHREAYHEIPPKVEYSLTPLGVSLNTALEPLGRWGEEHMQTLEALPR